MAESSSQSPTTDTFFRPCTNRSQTNRAHIRQSRPDCPYPPGESRARSTRGAKVVELGLSVALYGRLGHGRLTLISINSRRYAISPMKRIQKQICSSCVYLQGATRARSNRAAAPMPESGPDCLIFGTVSGFRVLMRSEISGFRVLICGTVSGFRGFGVSRLYLPGGTRARSTRGATPSLAPAPASALVFSCRDLCSAVGTCL